MSCFVVGTTIQGLRYTLMHYASLKNYYFVQNVKHQHTPSKTDHTLLIFGFCSLVSFVHLLC